MNSFVWVVPVLVTLVLIYSMGSMVRLISETMRGLREEPDLTVGSRVIGWCFVSFLFGLILLCGFAIYLAVEAALTW